MALVDNRTQLQDCENNNNVSGDTTASPTLAGSDTGTTIEGTNSIGFQCDDAQEAIWFDQNAADATFNIDLSDSTVYVNVKHNLGETFANLGGLICLKDTADGGGGDGIGYAVNGSDVAGFPYIYRFTGIKLDVSVVVASPGTNDIDYYQYFGTEAGLNHAAILQVGYGTFNITKAVSSALNAWIDGIYYIANDSYAVTIQGGTVGTPETMVDVAADDLAVGMVLFNNPKGTEYGFFGPTEWGTPSGTADSYFTSEGEQWYFVGDNAGGHAIGATHFPFRLIGNSTGTNSWVLNSTVIVNTGTLCQFDMSDSNMDTATMESCSLIGLGAITLPNAGTAKSTLNCTFSSCGVVTSSGGDMSGSSILTPAISANTSGLVWNLNQDPNGELDNMTFTKTSGTAHHAIEFGTAIPDAANYTLTGCKFGTDFSATEGGTTGDETFHFLDTTGSITLNLIGCTGNKGYRTAGVAVTIVDAPVTTSVTVTDHEMNPYLGARVLVKASSAAGDLPYNETVSYSVSQIAFRFDNPYESPAYEFADQDDYTGGGDATVTITHDSATPHNMATGQKVLITGLTPYAFNGVKTITVIDSLSYSYTASGEASPTGTAKATGVIISGLTDSSGYISDSRVFSLAQPVTGIVRQATYSPLYKDFPLSGTVSITTGLPLTAMLTLDE